ncbi:hypothetical protein AB0I30_05955 [Nocardia tengchongensis]|uniref:ABC-2 type transport system permease protein n=1 Tax=Nocardia tengchongensis TaxID=2055889 RepID=A0ABX8CTH0_9NOCA|nr:hypothetical protein [Nocardia tengchongensis]QVI23210.1 hypothetical protein KHQ06_10045 [Nocardia tengchongensis]
MVGVLIRMRLRITARSMREGRAALNFWLGTLFGVLAAIATALIIATAHETVHGGVTIAAALYGAWTLGWICGPVLTGSSDETLQPEQFRLLPLTPRQLAYGLGAAAFVGPAPIVNLIAFGGLVLLAAQIGWGATVIAALGVVLQLVFVVLLARTVVAWLGAAMRSRRGKDLGVLFAALIGLAYYPLNLLISTIGPKLDGDHGGLSVALRAVPSGWAPYAVEAAARGNYLLALVPLLGLALLSLVLWQSWAVLLERRLTTPAAPESQVLDSGGGLLDRFLPTTPVGAVVAKELRTWWRDGRRRAALIPLLIIGFVLPIFLSVRAGGSGTIPFSGAFVVWLATMSSTNLYGFDGTAVWQTLVTPGAARADVRGRAYAWALLVAPLALLATLILPGALGRTQLYPWALSTLPVLFGVGMGAVVYLSTHAAFALPPQRGNPFAGTGNPGCMKMLMQLAVGVVQLLATAPVLAILGIGAALHNPLIQWAALPIGVLLGIVAALLGIRLATTRLAARGPELLAEVKPR